ncbi:hypothetical protein PC9H_010815 [Pleurotus ostreatus]|uniref:Pentatricopeptide repeat-containing protein n=2 Tax=Pleurotus ostreatus TaxID=5322 RepID=A0A8H6ZMT2_PLEOS|nr:uncharacterized protein PC9H_010815 [Pleurotus ostreatus]KAF7422659.1 hypothetical protein PC9H_010815 [Pleurotus ostreatus]KAJ8691454.1 hypothetical protein PTI98_011023 [Pleurotus ostreatus]
MSCCRRLLFQVHFLNLINRYPSSRYTPSNAILPSIATANTRRYSSGLLPSRQGVPSQTRRRQTDHVVVEDERGHLEAPSSEGQMEARPHIDNLLEYEALRCQGGAQLDGARISWVILLNGAIASGNSTAISHLVADLVNGSIGMHQNRVAVLYAYLARVDSQMLGAKEVYLLLQGLSNNPSAIRDIPLQIVEKLTLWLVGIPNSSLHYALLSDIIHSLLLSRLGDVKAPTGARMIGYRPPSIVYAAFRLIRRCMTSKNFDKRIIKLFRTLAQSRNIPPEAIQTNDNHTNDIHYIVAAALLRASLHWGWKGLGSNILKEILQHRCRYPEHITILTVDALYSLMDTPSRDDVSACRSILAAFHHGVPNAVVPDGLIRQFYKHACEHNMPRSAESVYALSRSHSIAKAHTYPPPQGSALPWLMGYLTHVSKNEHLARQLVAQVVDDYEPIPLQFRARFISFVAMNGSATHARNLWERYAVGKDKDAILAHSGLMLRMVDLFYHLSTRNDGQLNEDELIPRPSDVEPQIDEGNAYYDRSSASLTAFTDRVLSSFVRAHEPLATAHHYTLTSLARAFFILGRFSEGFETLKNIWDRKEVPDSHDINVALSALAVRKPRAAASMMERMLEKGIRPDPVSFGTVLHHALAHNDVVLATELIHRARDVNGGKITLKSVTSLIRASLRREMDVSERRSSLTLVLNILKALNDSGFTLAPAVGKYCMRIALDANEPGIAFKFWDLLLRRKTQWTDQEQRFLRERLARAIRSHRQHEKIRDAQSRMMLSHLREKRRVRRGR